MSLQEHMVALLGIFHKFSGGSKTIDKSQIAKIFNEGFKMKLSDRASEKILQLEDKDKSGALDFAEFASMAANITELMFADD